MLKDEKAIEIFAPNYYNNFKCISHKCQHSCCINWEICIDRCTYNKYKKIPDILKTLKRDGDDITFQLCEDGRCPHLNNMGLCNIIISHGEEYLSEICQNHPRFYNYVSENKIEAGLGIVCEEACRLILENEEPFSLYKIENTEGEGGFENVFNPLPLRNRIISLIESDGSFIEKIARLEAEFNIPKLYSMTDWIKRLLTLEILHKQWENDLLELKNKPFTKRQEISDKYGIYYARLLTYFVYRYVSVAESEANLRARLAFCILSAETISCLFEETVKTAPNTEKAPKALIAWARRYSTEIEYSEDNIDELIFLLESKI